MKVRILIAGVIRSSTSMSVVKTVRTVGRLSDVMQLEKQLTFSLIESLDVSLNETDRNAILKLPPESTLVIAAFCHRLDRRTA